jgi:hypothetical protein
MTEFGMNNSCAVYFDPGNYLTFRGVLSRTMKRCEELIDQGFTKEQILKIIFDNSQFKDSFLEEQDFYNLKRIIEEQITTSA